MYRNRCLCRLILVLVNTFSLHGSHIYTWFFPRHEVNLAITHMTIRGSSFINVVIGLWRQIIPFLSLFNYFLFETTDFFSNNSGGLMQLILKTAIFCMTNRLMLISTYLFGLETSYSQYCLL